MDILPFEIWQEIINFVNHLDFKSAIDLRQVCRTFYKLEIYDFHPPFKAMIGLKDPCLRSYTFIRKINLSLTSMLDISYLTRIENIKVNTAMTDDNIKHLNPVKFNMGYNQKISDLKHMKKIKKLNISRSKIEDEGLSSLNPEILISNGNKNLFDFNRMTNLRYLYLCFSSEIDNSALSEINLEHLDMEGCKGIKRIGHMTKLKVLNFTKNVKITDSELKNLDLIELTADFTKITDISHMTKLRSLSIRHTNVTSSGIRSFNLVDLDISGVSGITDINHMVNLKSLTIVNGSGLTQDGIKNITNLTYLDMSRSNTPYDLNHLKKLIRLEAADTEISDRDIKSLTQLEVLSVGRCEHIRDLSSLVNLIELGADETNLTNQGLQNLTKITYLELDNVSGVTDLNHMILLKVLSIRENSGVTNEGIKNLILTELTASKNSNIQMTVVLENMFAKFLDDGLVKTREDFDKIIQEKYVIHVSCIEIVFCKKY
jgi:hypothetical protein